jgi:hypothetical protein
VSRLTGALVLAAMLLGAPSALAASESSNPLNDVGGSPDYRSIITAVTPRTPGLTVQVLQFSDRLMLTNHTDRTVTVYGYSGEPYARLLANGVVQQNLRSPAYYLNQSFYANVTVPASANASAPPQWAPVDRTGDFEWHDHRIHYNSPALPPQVRDKSKRTLIFNWTVPISVGITRGDVAGQLYWNPNKSSAPTAVIVIGAVVVLGSIVFVLVVRRRRAGGGDATGAPAREAW